MSDDTEKTWHAIDVIVEKKAAEAVEFAFTSLDALGTASNQPRKANAETVTVTGYFNEPPDDKILHDELQHALQIYNFDDSALHSVTHGEVENTDWLVEWKKHWQPTIVGRFVIAPPWSDVADTQRIVIRIEPNMAFGTGTHETTQLCLKAIGDIYDADQTFLDVGTGTGILAIAAAKLQVKSKKVKGKILACDTDIDSITIARENATANGVGDKIECFVGSMTNETLEFDFVCANLTLDVITPLLPLLIAKSRRLLLLSGILTEQEAAITDELRKLQITNFDIKRSGEWISALIERS